MRRARANATTGAFNGAPYGATNRVKSVPNWVRRAHAYATTGAFGGTPYGATSRVTWKRRAHTKALGPL
eukprot:4644085-Pyramimonas_sp.AAC.1